MGGELRWLCLVALALPGLAAADGEISVALVKPGGGFLTTDGRQKIAIELIASDAQGPLDFAKVEIRANQGKTSGSEVIGLGRALFYYAPPDKPRATSDIIDLRLLKRAGGEVLYSVPIEVAAPASPRLGIDAKPLRFLAEKPEHIDILASAPAASQLAIEPSHGTFQPSGQSGGTRLSGTWVPPKDLPADAPSHLMALVSAVGPAGFSARCVSISALADIRVSTEIPPGNQLVLEGSENKPTPKTAAADGKTVIEDLVRYGAPIRAYSIKGKTKKEIPISIPSGLIPVAVAQAIPGQNIADGGTGPSIVVAVPPPPFGGELLWPELKVEGAGLVAVQPVPGSKDVKVLVLSRPKGPKVVNVLADGMAIAQVPFLAAHGEVVDLSATPAKSGERGAVIARIRDVFGSPAESPEPRARIDGGPAINIARIGVGEYRVSIPPGVPGEPGQIKTIVVELAPPKSLTGESLEFAASRQKVALEGPPPALVAKTEAEEPTAPAGPTGPRLRLGLTGGALGGSTFGGQLVIGADVSFEARFPVLGERLGAAVGVEALRGSGAGSVTLAPGVTQSSSFIFAGTVFPIGASFALLQLESFELLVRAALELRIEAGVIDVGVDRAGGATRFGIGFRAGAEGAFDVGPGAITVGLGLAGIGSSASGFSTDKVKIEGSVTHVRLDLGFRFWL